MAYCGLPGQQQMWYPYRYPAAPCVPCPPQPQGYPCNPCYTNPYPLSYACPRPCPQPLTSCYNPCQPKISKLASFVTGNGNSCTPAQNCCRPPQPDPCPVSLQMRGPLRPRCGVMCEAPPACLGNERKSGGISPSERLRNVDVQEELCYYVPSDDDRYCCYSVCNGCGNSEQVPSGSADKDNPVKYCRRQRYTFEEKPRDCPQWPFQRVVSCDCGCTNKRRPSCTPDCSDRRNGESILPRRTGVYYYDRTRQTFIPQEDLPKPADVIVRRNGERRRSSCREDSRRDKGKEPEVVVQPVIQPVYLPHPNQPQNFSNQPPNFSYPNPCGPQNPNQNAAPVPGPPNPCMPNPNPCGGGMNNPQMYNTTCNPMNPFGNNILPMCIPMCPQPPPQPCGFPAMYPGSYAYGDASLEGGKKKRKKGKKDKKRKSKGRGKKSRDNGYYEDEYPYYEDEESTRKYSAGDYLYYQDELKSAPPVRRRVERPETEKPPKEKVKPKSEQTTKLTETTTKAESTVTTKVPKKAPVAQTVTETEQQTTLASTKMYEEETVQEEEMFPEEVSRSSLEASINIVVPGAPADLVGDQPSEFMEASLDPEAELVAESVTEVEENEMDQDQDENDGNPPDEDYVNNLEPIAVVSETEDTMEGQQTTEGEEEEEKEEEETETATETETEENGNNEESEVESEAESESLQIVQEE